MAAREDIDYYWGVDLYPPENMEGFEFTQGDLMDIPIQNQFDNVCCVSSFEHAGIERHEINGEGVKIEYHREIAEKLKSLVKPGGVLIITCPFGPNELWFTDGKGYNFRAGEEGTAAWGFRTFTLDALIELFSPLSLVKASAFRLLGSEYFEITNWYRIDPEKDAYIFTGDKVNTGVICVVFENR